MTTRYARLIPAVLAGELTVGEAVASATAPIAEIVEFYGEVTQATLDHWRAQRPETPTQAPVVYALIGENGLAETLLGAYSTYTLAEAAGATVKTPTHVRKIIVDGAPL